MFFVMVWERKNGEVGLGVCVCELFMLYGWVGCSGCLVYIRVYGECGLSLCLGVGY